MKRLLLAGFALTLGTSIAVSVVAATSSVHPVVDARYGYLLGGSKNGKWLNDKAVAKALRGGETYRVYGVSTRLGERRGKKSNTGEAPCDQTHWVKFDKSDGKGVLALGATWNAVPRNARPQSVTQNFYRNAVARILKKNGIKNPKVVIEQLWRVDLDGDGADEVLLAATHHAGLRAGPMQISPNAKAGEYSLALLRKVVRGRVRTVILASEYYVRDSTFSAPNVYRFAGVMDANGDGKMEIVLRSRYYEGDAIGVLEVKGAQVKEVLSAGCGA